MEGGKGPGFKRRNESRVGNMMVNVVKKWKRKGEKIRWWNQQFIEMVSRALGGGTEEIRISWQHCRETLCGTAGIVKLQGLGYQMDLETPGNPHPSNPSGYMCTAGK